MHAVRISNVNLATMTGNPEAIGIERDTELWLGGGKILAVGRVPDGDFVHTETIDAQGMWCLPGWIDCHTHLVYGGSRANEFEARQAGLSYAQIHARGGGISATVSATRQASDQQLLDSAIQRASRLADEGVTTVEIKSGYGLDEATEQRMLTIAGRLADHVPMHIVRTFLGAHALPPEYQQDADGYIRFVCAHMIPLIARQQLADAVDVFCESVGFNLAHTQQVFDAAKKAGLALKIHAEQLSDQKGAVLAARYGALSVDHIEYLAPDDVPTLARAGTTAVLLPGAFFYLKECQLPPIEALRMHQVPMAIASDCNPGTSPIASLLTCATLACLQFNLTVTEALRGITTNAARALGLHHTGSLAPGQQADCCLWAINDPSELIYEMNAHRPVAKWLAGRRVV